MMAKKIFFGKPFLIMDPRITLSIYHTPFKSKDAINAPRRNIVLSFKRRLQILGKKVGEYEEKGWGIHGVKVVIIDRKCEDL